MPELIDVTPGSPEWLAARRAGVTATDIVTILGLSSWSSPYSLYWQKLGQVPEAADSDRFRLGRELEPYVVSRWCDERDVPPAHREGARSALYRHSDRAWQMATLDRLFYDEPVEVKTWADADRHSWDDAPPATVRAQVLWQMDVMDVAAGHVGVVFLPSGEFRSYTIEHEPTYAGSGWGCNGDTCSLCADQLLMRAAGLEFMGRLRLELPAPDLDASAATLAAVRARFAKVPDKEAEVSKTEFDSWAAAKKASDQHAEMARGYESQLREQAGEASVLTVDGQPVARRYVMDQQVKAHTRHMDYLKRIKTEANGDD